MFSIFTPAMWTPGPIEIIAVAILGLLLFGKRLPSIARSIGRSLVEFKQGMREVTDEVNHAVENEDADTPAAADPETNTNDAGDEPAG